MCNHWECESLGWDGCLSGNGYLQQLRGYHRGWIVPFRLEFLVSPVIQACRMRFVYFTPESKASVSYSRTSDAIFHHNAASGGLHYNNNLLQRELAISGLIFLLPRLPRLDNAAIPEYREDRINNTTLHLYVLRSPWLWPADGTVRNAEQGKWKCGLPAQSLAGLIPWPRISTYALQVCLLLAASVGLCICFLISI